MCRLLTAQEYCVYIKKRKVRKKKQRGEEDSLYKYYRYKIFKQRNSLFIYEYLNIEFHLVCMVHTCILTNHFLFFFILSFLRELREYDYCTLS